MWCCICRVQLKSQLWLTTTRALCRCRTKWYQVVIVQLLVRKSRPVIILSLAAGGGPRLKLSVAEVLTPVKHRISYLTLTAKVHDFDYLRHCELLMHCAM